MQIANYNNIDKCQACGCKDLKEARALEPQFPSPTFVESNTNNPSSDIKVLMSVLVCQNKSFEALQ